MIYLDHYPLEKVKEFVTPDDPEVKRLAEALNYDPVAFYEYVRDIPYSVWCCTQETCLREGWLKPSQSIKSGKSMNCICKSLLLCSLLRASGYDSWVVACYLPNRRSFHAYVELLLNGELIKLETTDPHLKFGEFPTEKVVDLVFFNEEFVSHSRSLLTLK